MLAIPLAMAVVAFTPAGVSRLEPHCAPARVSPMPATMFVPERHFLYQHANVAAGAHIHCPPEWVWCGGIGLAPLHRLSLWYAPHLVALHRSNR